jgi:homoserine kinase
MQASIEEGSRFYHEGIHITDGLKFCAIIPDFTLSTREARAVLPKSVSYKDAVFNAGRASLLIAALTSGNFDLLKYACRDKLHQPYRGSLIRNYEEVVEESRNLKSLGVFLSGAGPTIMALLKEDDNDFSKSMKAYISKLEGKWIVKELNLCHDGAAVKR